MAKELFLYFPFGDEDDIKCAETLREKSRNRMRSAVLISDHGVDTSDVGSLIRDAEELCKAAQLLDDGESVDLHQDMSEEDPCKVHEHARAVRCAIDGLLETELENETSSALSELAFGLECTLAVKAKAERGASRARDEFCSERADTSGQERVDPLSPAALEKSIGLSGLRRLREAIANDFDAVLNHIEYYVERREDAPFKPGYSEDGTFESLRKIRDKIDPTKPLGYYDGSGDPVQPDAQEIVDTLTKGVAFEIDHSSIRDAIEANRADFSELLMSFVEAQDDPSPGA